MKSVISSMEEKSFVLVEGFGASWKPKGVLQYSEEPMT
jgi:hypothetical protein